MNSICLGNTRRRDFPGVAAFSSQNVDVQTAIKHATVEAMERLRGIIVLIYAVEEETTSCWMS
jgi:hypothetical protein